MESRRLNTELSPRRVEEWPEHTSAVSLPESAKSPLGLGVLCSELEQPMLLWAPPQGADPAAYSRLGMHKWAGESWVPMQSGFCWESEKIMMKCKWAVGN